MDFSTASQEIERLCNLPSNFPNLLTDRFQQYAVLHKEASKRSSWIQNQKKAGSIIDLHPISRWVYLGTLGYNEALCLLNENVKALRGKPHLKSALDRLFSDNPGFWSARSEIVLAAYFQRRGCNVELEPAVNSGKVDIGIISLDGSKVFVEVITPQARLNQPNAYSESDLWDIIQACVKELKSDYAPVIEMYPYDTWLTKEQVSRAIRAAVDALHENAVPPQPFEEQISNGNSLRITFQRQHYLTGGYVRSRNPLDPTELAQWIGQETSKHQLPAGVLIAIDLLLEKSDYYDLGHQNAAQKFWSNFPWNDLSNVAGLLLFWSDIGELEPSRRYSQLNPSFSNGAQLRTLFQIWESGNLVTP